ncbi:hypothetical protein SISNIDRAFT_460579 [Sistotremastrum niveocremeum HHB9708]|uniref:Uncharacterized protein n=1 Tax=Sistotremastrum niveocremeum HHB9708 TaxID=1314777 RepID=A0A164NKV8_9AGAM|nr:hypothetical protein SISNIDRAFT_460579 [Sistotremastrum niveocremeum HHB9708]
MSSTTTRSSSNSGKLLGTLSRIRSTISKPFASKASKSKKTKASSRFVENFDTPASTIRVRFKEPVDPAAGIHPSDLLKIHTYPAHWDDDESLISPVDSEASSRTSTTLTTTNSDTSDSTQEDAQDDAQDEASHSPIINPGSNISAELLEQLTPTLTRTRSASLIAIHEYQAVFPVEDDWTTNSPTPSVIESIIMSPQLLQAPATTPVVDPRSPRIGRESLLNDFTTDPNFDPKHPTRLPDWFIEAWQARELKECRDAAETIPLTCPTPPIPLARRPLTSHDDHRERIWHGQIRENWEEQMERKAGLEDGSWCYYGEEGTQFKKQCEYLSNLRYTQHNPPIPLPMPPFSLKYAVPVSFNEPYPLLYAPRPLTYADHQEEVMMHREMKLEREVTNIYLALQAAGCLEMIPFLIMGGIAFCFLAIFLYCLAQSLASIRL